jgi:hypothetical protein
MAQRHKLKIEEVKDDFWDMLKYLPPVIWYVGMFSLGYVVGTW